MNITTKQLMHIAISNDEFENKYPGIALLIKPKLREFYKNNGVRISSAMEKAEEIDRKYHDVDAEGKMVLKEGANKEDWEKESSEFLKQEIRLIV